MKNYPTAHINAAPTDFAETVLMPGDPLRAKFIAENMLSRARLVNDVRGVQGYTGEYRGKAVSVMASGMGMPSMGIYSCELFNIFGTENIIRIGTAGATRADIPLRSVFFAMGASTNSAYASQFNLNGSFSAVCSYSLLRDALLCAKNLGIKAEPANILTSDTFYTVEENQAQKWAQMGIKCIEMETAALYINAARAGKNALSILTVSDNIITGAATDAKERQTAFAEMVQIALETAYLH